MSFELWKKFFFTIYAILYINTNSCEMKFLINILDIQKQIMDWNYFPHMDFNDRLKKKKKKRMELGLCYTVVLMAVTIFC